jgi:ubiquinone/menaquinone biosynthesis C-methylase UbiE
MPLSNVNDSPFAEAAPYYKHRAPYPAEALDYVCDALKLDSSSNVLDLGCGTGTIAIPLSRVVGHVLAVDSCPEMIAEGRSIASAASCQNIEWLCAFAEELDERHGPFELATIGQAFHWMDRDEVLKKLASVLVPERGALALINPGKRRPQESWEPRANEIVERYLGKIGRHPKMKPELKHESALLRSTCFTSFTSREFSIAFERDISSIISYIYSTSTTPRSAFGARTADFERELTVALLSMKPSGIFSEQTETEVLLAPYVRKPKH